MDDAQNRAQTRLPLFAAYINERIAIRQRRLAGKPWPWTADPILREWKFTNARRAWDRTTEWLVANWYTPHFNHPNVGVACALARFICHVDTLDEIGFPLIWDPTRIIRVCKARKQRKEKIFTGAYIISGGGSEPGEDKITNVVRGYVARAIPLLRDPRSFTANSCQLVYDQLRHLNGWGAFMTQEVVQDLLCTNLLSDAADRHTFAVAGPGAIRGLRWVLGDAVDKIDGVGSRKFTEAKATEEMTAIYKTLRGTNNPAIALPMSYRRDMTVHDIEFNLCEFDKYMRVKTGQGTPRSRYKLPQDQTTLDL